MCALPGISSGSTGYAEYLGFLAVSPRFSQRTRETGHPKFSVARQRAEATSAKSRFLTPFGMTKTETVNDKDCERVRAVVSCVGEIPASRKGREKRGTPAFFVARRTGSGEVRRKAGSSLRSE
jgi:hypothetical protein